jgi:linoleoyl-CoA desaturase
MVAKTIILLAATIVPYALIVSNQFSPWTMLGLCVAMGFGVAGVGFSVAHDALHGAYSSRSLVNRVLGSSFDLLGGNAYVWKLTHNVIHHTYTNIHGLDGDLDSSPLIRFSPHAPWRPIHRLQHIYAFAAYSLATLLWVFVSDYAYMRRRDLGPYRNLVHPRREVVKLFITKLIYYGYAIVVPLLVLDVAWWQFVIGFLAMHLTAGFILGIVFQLAHVVEGPEQPLPDENGAMGVAWMVHEMRTTSNFAPSNKLLSWYIGGLNYQIEHHLFPRVCSIHYPAIAGMVREAARKHGIPYHSHATFRAAVRSHYQQLKKLGRPDPIPVPAA